jgi:hypothetical protein
MKVAVTLLAAFIVTLQVPLPVQAPDQPLNRDPAAGIGVRLTTVPALYLPDTGADRAMLAPLTAGATGPGWGVIVPSPTVDRVRVNCTGGGGVVVKVAVTLLAASIVTLQAPVPEQAPDQPLN